ncbi:hypothetical protein U1Q18_028057 [Sarracenia purpurea var. burkii]
MDNSGKIICAKYNEIQTVNIKSVGADYEVNDGERLPLAVKEMGTCDVYPQVSWPSLVVLDISDALCVDLDYHTCKLAFLWK